jgi:tetratricopeptide (TPR) repeat protein
MGLPVSYSNPDVLLEFYLQLGDVYHAMEKHAQSDSCFVLALDINPNNPFVLNNYAYYLSLRSERLEEARAMSWSALQLLPDNYNLLDTYAWILYKQGDFNEALLWQWKALEKDPTGSAVLLEHYGDILYKLNRVDEAVQYWQRAMDNGGEAEVLGRKIAARQLVD